MNLLSLLSDRITQFCSHMFILRQKTTDEIADDGSSFGTHKLINVKARHLGKDIAGACEPVQVGDNLRKNFINLQFRNFNITECGDLRDIVAFRDNGGDLINTQDLIYLRLMTYKEILENLGYQLQDCGSTLAKQRFI